MIAVKYTEKELVEAIKDYMVNIITDEGIHFIKGSGGVGSRSEKILFEIFDSIEWSKYPQ